MRSLLVNDLISHHLLELKYLVSLKPGCSWMNVRLNESTPLSHINHRVPRSTGGGGGATASITQTYSSVLDPNIVVIHSTALSLSYPRL